MKQAIKDNKKRYHFFELLHKKSIDSHIKSLLSLVLFCLSANTVSAQTHICTKRVSSVYADSTFMGVKQLGSGRVYSRCWIAPEYTSFPDSNFTISPQGKAKPPIRFRVIEPVIAIVVDSITEKQGTSEWVLKTTQNRNKSIKILPPVYRVTTTEKEISPNFTRWILKRGNEVGLSQNPDDCIVFAFVERQAQYKTLTERVELKPARKVQGTDTLLLDSTELKRFGTIQKIVKKTTYYHEVLKSKGEIILYDYDCNIKHPTKTKKLMRAGGLSEWKECLCGCTDSGMSYNKLYVQNIQKALKMRGYYKGKINNKLNDRTKTALLKFQNDSGLPIGSFDLQTMRALEVSAY